MSVIDVSPQSATRPSLRRLYFVRAAFAVVWAVLFAVTSSPLGTVALALAVIYPAFDAAASWADARATGGKAARILRINVAISAVAAVAFAIFGNDDREAILLIWGAWAIVSGALQLGEGLVRRRKLGGQLPIMLSGGISVLAGASFAVSADSATTLANIAAYATLGGVFFLVSALRLGRTPRSEGAAA